MRGCSRDRGANSKAPSGQSWNHLNEIMLDYNPRNKINIHESALTHINYWINKGRAVRGGAVASKMHLPCRRNPNNWCRFSTLEALEPESLFLKCGLHTGTSLQSVQREGWKGAGGPVLQFTEEKPGKCYLCQVIKVNIDSDKSY